MKANSAVSKNANLFRRFRDFFTARDFIFHDGRALRRFSVAGRTQAALAGIAAITVVFSAYGVTQATASAVAASGIAGLDASPQARVERMRAKMLAMQADVAEMKETTKAHVARVEQRQAMIAAVLAGKGDPDQLAQLLRTPASDGLPSDLLKPLRRVEQRQLAFAVQAREAVEQRYAKTARHLRKLGINPDRLTEGATAMGGPFEPADSAEAAAAETATAAASTDAQFRSLFMTWKKLDTLEQAVISVPSLQPVANVSLSSSFGVRSDPFRGTAAMHAGVDIPGPLGTPVYATADGIVSRAGRAGGYGNLIEINHGKGIATRYGHLSKILVSDNSRVRRGQLIGLMGSTGRSTGSHLHYEVRIDGRAVNPMPYLQTTDYLLAIQDRALKTQQAAVGGPAD